MKRSEAARARLREDVALMRDLGVTEWNGIRLGERPAPPKREPTADEIKARQDRDAERRHDIMFAATSVRPGIPRGA